MNAKHTPGPWGCTDTSHHAHDYRLTKPDGSLLPLTVEANDHSEQRANARLIAAAPDLLTSLRAIHHQLTNGEASEGNLRDIRWCASQADAAIAKAEGH